MHSHRNLPQIVMPQQLPPDLAGVSISESGDLVDANGQLVDDFARAQRWDTAVRALTLNLGFLEAVVWFYD